MQCHDENKSHRLSCLPSYLDCNSLDLPERQYWLNITRVVSKCDAKSKINIKYKFGMFADAFLNDVVSSSFKERYFYCLWWGLRNLRYGISSSLFLRLGMAFLLLIPTFMLQLRFRSVSGETCWILCLEPCSNRFT